MPSQVQNARYKADRELTEARLAWPEDALYDFAAFQRSGIEDPVALGLIDNPFRRAA